MPRDSRIDTYIEKAADFARPILTHLREAVHAACPEAEETIKWGMPAFLYKGKQLAGMAAFRSHATFGFWRGKEVVGEAGAERKAMGQFGRLESMDDVPDEEVLHGLISKAMALAGSKPKRQPGAPKPELPMPDDLLVALNAAPGAAEKFAAFPPGCRREYVEWVTEAKRPETRARRILQAAGWIAEGKRRNWKYEQC